MAGLLSRERIVAGPGFNRWLVPPAALAIHLSIGMAYGFSVFWLPLSKAIGLTQSVPCPDTMSFLQHVVRHELRLEDQHARLDVHAVLRLPRLVRGGVRTLARARRAAEGGRGRRVLLGRRVPPLGPRRASPSDLAPLARLRRDRRMRARPGLHLAGLDAHQVVSRPPRHGHRHGDHGVRRRRDDRGAAGRSPDEALRHGHLGRRAGDLRHHGRDLLHRHAGGRLRLSGAAHRLEAGGLGSRRSGRAAA